MAFKMCNTLIYCTISEWNTGGFLILLQNSALQKKANSELPCPKSLPHASVASNHYLLPTQTKLSPKNFQKFLLSLWKTRAEQLLNSMHENRQPQSNLAESKPDASSIIKTANANEQPVFVSCEVVSCTLELETNCDPLCTRMHLDKSSWGLSSFKTRS